MKRLITLFFLMHQLCAFAQSLSVTVLPVTGFNLQLNAITGFTIMNTSGETKLVHINYAFKSGAGETLAEGRLDNFSMAPGITPFNAAANSLSYSNIRSSFNLDEFGVIPHGQYMICVDVIDAQNLEPLASSCADVETVLLSPPQLVYPLNEQEIPTLNPSLSWLPPTPSAGNAFLYKIKVVEIQSNQNPFDAVLNNFAVLEENGITYTGMLYPLTAQTLEYGKTYAWKVFAYTPANKLLGETEIWTFKPVMPDTTNLQAGVVSNAVILDAEKNKKAVTVVKTLRVQSPELINVPDFDFTIRDGANHAIEKNTIQVKAEGNGLFSFTFSNAQSMHNKTYTLEVKTPKKKSVYATFLYKAEN